MRTVRLGLLAAAAVLLLGSPAVGGVGRMAVKVGELTRHARVFVPSRLPRDRAVPLLLVFHGAGSTTTSMVRATGFDVLAERHGFVVVYPEALGGRFDAGASGESAPRAAARGRPDDIAFVRALLTGLRKRFKIDAERIYATGFSNGAMFCYRLASELADDIAAIAPVAGALGQQVSKAPSSPVSVLHVHGAKDERVPFRGPGGRTPRYRSVPDSLRTWATWCGCRKTTSPRIDPLEPAPGFRVERRWYGDCPKGVGVGLLLVEGEGHTWPQGAQAWITRSIHAFFERHPKVVPAPKPAPPPAFPAPAPPEAAPEK